MKKGKNISDTRWRLRGVKPQVNCECVAFWVTLSSCHTAAHYTFCLYQRETNIKVTPLYFTLNAKSSRELKDFIMESDTTLCVMQSPILSKLHNFSGFLKEYISNI